MRKSTYSTSSASSSRAWLRWAGVIVIFGSFIALIWYAASNRDNLMRSEDDLELILPSAGPVKVRAEDPGGMEVDNRDKQVFDLLDSSKPEFEIEREDLCASEDSATLCNKKLPKVTALAADPKEAEEMAQQRRARPKSADIALLIENYEVGTSASTVQGEEDPQEQQTASNVESVTVAPEAVKMVEPVQSVKSAVKEKAEAEQESDQKTDVAETVEHPKLELAKKDEIFTEGAWGVQLASYRSLASADDGSKIFLKRYPDILSKLTYVTEKVDIPNKGTFYRVQFVGLKDKVEAKKACDAIKAQQKDGCWYVSR
ncbi:MAG: hypothetical protein CMF61_06005 [Magnetococcales bacterium]|nr:hypothetical protein [Magnetococcales bacterium]